MRKLCFILVPLLFVACTDSQPVAPDVEVTPDLGVAGNSGCYTVKFYVEVSGAPPFFSGAATGDIEATVEVLFDDAASVFHGVVLRSEGVVTWHVSGGIIQELEGETFRTSTRSNLLTRPDNDPLIWEIVGTDRALDGVTKANLTYRGTFVAAPPFDTDLDYQGVICP